MAVFCDRLKLDSTAALDCRTGQNKGRYRKKKSSYSYSSLYIPPYCKKVDLIWNKCGHGNGGLPHQIHRSLVVQTVLKKLKYFLKLKSGPKCEVDSNKGLVFKLNFFKLNTFKPWKRKRKSQVDNFFGKRLMQKNISLWKRGKPWSVIQRRHVSWLFSFKYPLTVVLVWDMMVRPLTAWA